MIKQAILLLRDELQNYISFYDASVNVTVDNIGLMETARGDNLNNNIVITLVNIEEESTLKNNGNLKRPILNQAIYKNVPVYLNLYILFTCNYAGNDYRLALERLSFVIRFLQGQTSFSASSSSVSAPDFADTDLIDLKFTMELYTLTFEQINHLWGSLGGRQVPFAMYKLRLVAITDNIVARKEPVIEEIGTGLFPFK
jgi:hypothetical protein